MPADPSTSDPLHDAVLDAWQRGQDESTAPPAAAEPAPPPPAPNPPAPLTPAVRPNLGGWNAYFLAKLALFWQGVIGLHAVENLAFATLLLVPLRRHSLATVRWVVALPLAAALLYHDSYLPPLSRLFAQAAQVASFSPAYLVEIVQRFFSWPAAAGVIAAIAGYTIAARHLRVGVLVVATLLVMVVMQRPTRPPGMAAGARAAPATADAGGGARVIVDRGVDRGAEPDDPGEILRQRRAAEATRRVEFTRPPAGTPAFDILFVHVCSMSWDDLRATGLERHPLFARLDIVLTQFNSAASYSGPAVIRLLRAPCGQLAHDQLYAAPADNACHLMPALKQAGFETRLALNHDGHFDDFLGLVRAQGNAGLQPQRLDGLPVAQRSFDDSPIYDDLAVLRRWATETAGAAAGSATYFNTISLHDGNRLVGANSGLNSLASYKLRLTTLLDKLDAFVAELERRDRRAVVVLLPEHGAALRGDRMQIAGMREIPTPAITHVPVGIKVVGAGVRRRGEPVRVDHASSYLAVSTLVGRLLERPPFGDAGFAPADYARELPGTAFVAEHAGTVMLGRDDKYFLRIGNDAWTEYPAGQP